MTHSATTRSWMLLGALLASAAFASTTTTEAGASTTRSPVGIGIRLLAAPHLPRAGHPTSVYIVSEVRPGTALKRRIEIFNTTDVTQRVSVYPAAASMRSGDFSFSAGRSSNALSRWTTLAVHSVVLSPNTSRDDAITIAVPRHSIRGRHYAVVWAQISSRPAPGSSVRLVSRVGVRIYLTVGSGGRSAQLFAVGKPVASRTGAGVPTVTATVVNLGVSAVGVSGTLTLQDGPGGIGFGPVTVSPITVLAPGDLGQVTVHYNRSFPRGPWRAAVSLSNGSTGQTKVSEIMFPAVVTSSPWWRSTGVEIGPLAILSVIMLALAGRALARRHARRQRLVPGAAIG